MNNGKILVLSAFFILIILLPAYGSSPAKGIPNPAAAYCEKVGYAYEIDKAPDGERGICVVTQGVEFEAWGFFRGKVGKEYSYCAKKGYDTETEHIDRGSHSEEYAVCVSKPEKVRIPLDELMGEKGDSLIGAEPYPIRSGEKDKQIIDKETGGSISESKGTQSGGGKDYGAKSLPALFDWRDVNGHSYIGGIQDQGDCGSCYAFAAVASAEGTYNVAENLTDENCSDFSEAFLAFCLSDYYAGFDGCSGASYDYEELDAMVDEGMGICNESAFPYTDHEQPCHSPAWNEPRIEFDLWSRIEYLDIDAIKAAIMTHGVIDVAVNVDTAFQNYNTGIHTDSQTSCPNGYNTTTNHAVALVGWGYDAGEGDYWILRNSWGTDWGENGYMRIAATSARVACAPTHLVFRKGKLQPYLIEPTSDINVNQNEFFTFSSGVKCVNGFCGDVNATLDPETELIYDDGSASAYYTNTDFIWAVRFTPPFQPFTVTKAKVQLYNPNYLLSSDHTLRVYEDDGGTPGNILATYNITITDFYASWAIIPITVPIESGDFWIGITAPGDPSGTYMFNDGSGQSAGRSYYSSDGVIWNLLVKKDLMIRAFVVEGVVKGVIPMNSGTPFYTTSANPQTCSNMQANDICVNTWDINATGDIDSTHELFTIYESVTRSYIDSNRTESVDITIVEPTGEYVSITLSGYPVEFGGLDPGTDDNAALGNAGNQYIITVDPTTTVNVDLYQKGTDFNGADTIAISNMKTNTVNDLGSAVSMSTAYGSFELNVSQDTNVNAYYWLSIPSGKIAGPYSADISVKAVETEGAP